jgi:fucose permease
MAYWLPAYAEKVLKFSQWTAGMGFLGFSVAMAVGRAGVGLLPKNIGPIRLMVACCTASIGLFLLASFAPWNSLALACCVLAGLAASCLWPSTLAVVADQFPNGGATMFAMLAAMGNFGGIFTPWVVGAVADHSSLRYGLSTAALCPLIMIPTLLWLGARYVGRSTPAVRQMA